MDDRISWVLWALAGAAGAEFFLLRFLLRLGAVLPEAAWVAAAMDWVYRLGLAALNAAVVLGVVTLAAVAAGAAGVGRHLRRRGSGLLRAAAVLAGVAAGAGFLPYVLGIPPGGPAVTLAAGAAGAAALALALAAWWRSPGAGGPGRADVAARTDLAARALPLLPAGALMAAYLHVAAGMGWPPGLPAGLAPWSQRLAETLAVAAPAVTWLALRPGRHLGAAAGAALAAALPAGLLAAPAGVLAALAMWTLGFTLFLPVPVYVVALWAYAYVVLRAVTTPGWQPAGLGLLLVGLGGLRVEDSYFGLLGLVGVLLVVAERPPAARSRGA